MDTGEIAKCYRSGLSPSPSPQPPASSHHCLHFSICSLDSIPSFIWHSTCRFPREARPHRPILTAPIGPTLPVPSLALFSFLAPLSPRRHAFCVCPVALSAPVSSVSAGTRTLHGRFLSTWHGERPRESPREFINQELTPTNLRSTCVWTIYAEPGPGRRPGDPQSSARPRKAESPELLSGSSQAPGLRTCCVSASNAPKLPSRLPCLLHWSLSLLAFRPSLPQPPWLETLFPASPPEPAPPSSLRWRDSAPLNLEALPQPPPDPPRPPASLSRATALSTTGG